MSASKVSVRDCVKDAHLASAVPVVNQEARRQDGSHQSLDTALLGVTCSGDAAWQRTFSGAPSGSTGDDVMCQRVLVVASGPSSAAPFSWERLAPGEPMLAGDSSAERTLVRKRMCRRRSNSSANIRKYSSTCKYQPPLTFALSHVAGSVKRAHINRKLLTRQRIRHEKAAAAAHLCVTRVPTGVVRTAAHGLRQAREVLVAHDLAWQVRPQAFVSATRHPDVEGLGQPTVEGMYVRQN